MSDSITIIRKDVKHINLKVKPSGEVVLTAPTHSDEREMPIEMHM